MLSYVIQRNAKDLIQWCIWTPTLSSTNKNELLIFNKEMLSSDGLVGWAVSMKMFKCRFLANSAAVKSGKQGKPHHLLMTMLLILVLAAAVTAQNPPPPPDRIWFRQDTLPAGETCTSRYEKVKGTPSLNTGKDPIILTEDAKFKICIKFLEGTYTNPKTGESTVRAGRDWAHDSGRKSTCSDGCCEFQFGSLPKKYINWVSTSSDCSSTSAAKEAPLYFKAKAGESKKLCAYYPEKADGAPVWQLLEGTAAGCVGQCCTIKRNN